RIGVQDERARTAPASNGLRQQLELASVEDRWVLLSAHIRAAAASVLGLGVEQIDLRRGLFDLGMDSLMSVELKSRLEATVGQPLPTTLTFKYPTVAALTDFLARELGVETAAAGPTTAPAQPAPASSHDDLSEDDLATLLLERLEQIR